MAQETASDLFVDDFYFSALFDEDQEENQEIFSVSDDKYAEELQFQEALMASVIVSQMPNSLPTSSSCAAIQAIAVPNQDLMEIPDESEEESSSSLSFCEICVERKENDRMFATEACIHSFCSDCITKHVVTKIQDSITIVTCPGLDCKTVLELDSCRARLDREVVDLWDKVLCESLVPEFQKFYCPYKDCSAMLVNDVEGDEEISESECPFCHRLFCARCYVTWHAGVECDEFQRLNEDERGREDLMVRELANEKKWGRCPRCKFYVERTEGCPHMTCRCQFQFCYGCGEEWTQSHGGCQRN